MERRRKKKEKDRYLHVADIEPLVDRSVDGSSGLGGSSGDTLDDLVVSTDLVGALNGDVSTKEDKRKPQKIRTRMLLIVILLSRGVSDENVKAA